VSKKKKTTESFTVKGKNFTARAWVRADQETIDKMKSVLNEIKEKHDKEDEYGGEIKL
jgi:thymidylate synthase